MNFRTEITCEKSVNQISISDNLCFIGSCFAQNMGEIVSESGFSTLVNPSGILFNPISVANCLNNMCMRAPYTEKDIVLHKQMWYSWQHHGSFAEPYSDALLLKINNNLFRTASFLQKCNYLFITFGTAWVFKHVQYQEVVANCHKLPANQFERYCLGIEDIVNEWIPLVNLLQSQNSHLQVIFTVSPVRHLADGLHGNQLSKSILILAIDEICKKTQAKYFPSYEIMLDDLRDYRFFETDMVHPSKQAIEYISEKLFDSWFSLESRKLMQEVKQLKAAVLHKPLQPNADEYKVFIYNQINKANRLLEANPHLQIQGVIDELKSKIR
jgi:hypothetical protein